MNPGFHRLFLPKAPCDIMAAFLTEAASGSGFSPHGTKVQLDPLASEQLKRTHPYSVVRKTARLFVMSVTVLLLALLTVRGAEPVHTLVYVNEQS